MDKTLLGVIIGGVIALLPSLVTAVVSIVNEQQKQRHEKVMKRVDQECTAKITAIQQYSESIGVCIALKSPESYRDYMANFQRLSLYVSNETFQAMLLIDDPRKLYPDDTELVQLSILLRNELFTASSSYAPARDHQQKRAGKAAQKLHHFFSQCRTAIFPKPANPSDPVEHSTDQPESKGQHCKHISH